MENQSNEGWTEKWVEPRFKNVDRIGERHYKVLTLVWFCILYAVKSALIGSIYIKTTFIGSYDNIVVNVLVVAVMLILAFLLAISTSVFSGQKKVLIQEGHFVQIPPPKVPKVFPIYPPYRAWPNRLEDTTYGSASWDNPRQINRKYCHSKEEGDGFYINATTMVTEPIHGICAAGSGQGKGVSIILINLLSRPRCSWFILDPKGENAMISARWQKEAGQRVVLLDPWNEQKRQGATHGIEPSRFNPLAFIKGNPTEIPESCSAIAMMIAPDEAQTKEPYWNSRARSLIKTYLLHLITARPESEHHLGTIYDWLRLAEDERVPLWVEMRLNTALNGAVRKGINEFYDLSTDDGPLPGIISNAQDNTAFLDSEALIHSLTGNDFDPYDLNDGKTTVYLCLPERYLDSHNKWLRVVISVCLKACNYRPNKRVNFLLDEFAILGKMPDVQRAYEFARGQNVCVFSFVQGLSQLYNIYGQYGADVFLSCARLRQFFGIFDLSTQKYLSEYLGDTTAMAISRTYSKTVSGSYGSSWETGGGKGSNSTGSSWSISESFTSTPVARRLLTAEEVGKTSEIITFIDGDKYKLPRIPFWGNYWELIRQGKIDFYPADWDEWRDYHDFLSGRKLPEDEQFTNRFVPRADGRRVN